MNESNVNTTLDMSNGVALPSMSDQLRAYRLSEYEKLLGRYPTDLTIWDRYLGDTTVEGGAVAAAAWEKAVKVFPLYGEYWLRYLMFINNNFAKIGSLYSQCLIQCKYVKLWDFYIEKTKYIHQGTADYVQLVTQAYKFALEHIGMHFKSGQIWISYLTFLREQNYPNENLKTVTLRNTFRQSVLVPTSCTEILWKDYVDWEKSINTENLIPKDIESNALNVIAVALHLKKLFQSLFGPPLPPRKQSQEKVSRWKALLSYEEGNPLELSSDQLCKRIIFYYETCLVEMYFYPEFWFQFAQYHRKCGRNSNALSVLTSATKALPNVVLIHCTLVEQAATMGSAEFQTAKENMLRKAEELKQPLLWINLIKLVRKFEGIKEARVVFLQARKQPSCSYQVFLAAAWIEYWLNNEKEIAQKILESGLEHFVSVRKYVDEYISFHQFCTEGSPLTLMRSVFERLISVVNEADKEYIWEKYLNFEFMVGDQTYIEKLKERRNKSNDSGMAFSISDSSHTIFVDSVAKYKFRELVPCEFISDQTNVDNPIVRPDLTQFYPLNTKDSLFGARRDFSGEFLFEPNEHFPKRARTDDQQ